MPGHPAEAEVWKRRLRFAVESATRQEVLLEFWQFCGGQVLRCLLAAGGVLPDRTNRAVVRRCVTTSADCVSALSLANRLGLFTPLKTMDVARNPVNSPRGIIAPCA